MSATITREAATGTILARMHDRFADEMTAATGVRCLGLIVSVGEDINGVANPAKERLDIVFESAPVEGDVDDAIAAFPATPEPVADTFAVVSGNTYFLDRIYVRPGESVALDIHLHVAFGTAANFEPLLLDTYACVFRRSAGAVRGTIPNGARSGNIPSFAVQFDVADDYADIYATLRATGALTLISSEIIIISRGMVPA